MKPISSKRSYDTATEKIKKDPQNPKSWIARARGFLAANNARLAVEDAYRAQILTKTLELKKSTETDKSKLRDTRNQAPAVFVSGLLELNCLDYIRAYMKDNDMGRHGDAVREKYSDFLQLDRPSRKRAPGNPGMILQSYPWMDKRSPANVAAAKKTLSKLKLTLKQSTVTDNPDVLGLFAAKNFKKGELLSEHFPARVCETDGPGSLGLVKYVLREAVAASKKGRGVNYVSKGIFSTLTGSYTNIPQAFWPERHIKEIFEIIAPTFEV